MFEKLQTRRANRLGETRQLPQNQPSIVAGTIAFVNTETYSCTVIIDTTKERLEGVPFPGLARDPESGGGSVTVPKMGQRVLVQKGFGHPTILQVIPGATDSSSPTRAFNLFDTSAGALNPGDSSSPANFRGDMPQGLLPGDHVRVGSDGQHLGVFTGGMVKMQATPWAGVTASTTEDTLHLRGKNLNVTTGFGDLRFNHRNGKNSLVFNGSTNQVKSLENNPWPFQFKIGEGEGMMSLGFYNTQGNPIYKQVVSADGDLSHNMGGNLSQIVDGSIEQQCGNGYSQNVVQGNHLTYVASGDHHTNVSGSMETSVANNIGVYGRNDIYNSANRDYTVSAGRNVNILAAGSLLAVPGDNALAVTASNGSVNFDIGMPGTDLNISQSGMSINIYPIGGEYKLQTLAGNIGMTSWLKDIVMGTPAGNIVLNTNLPGSVKLGASMGVAPFHAVTWEMLCAVLTQMIGIFDSHMHYWWSPMTPPIVPMSPFVPPQFETFKSQRVLIGL